MRVAIGVQVGSIEGARHGLPSLLDLFDEYKVKASFFVSLGPDRSVNLWRRLTGAAFISDAARAELERLAASGHEVGLAPFDPVAWEQQAAHADRAWTRRQLNPALDVYDRTFDREPCCFGAAGFQINPHLVSMEGELGLKYAADVRGQTLFLPRVQRVNGECPQIPATLPCIETALRARGVDEHNVHEHLFDLSQKLLPTGHVWRISAEEEGIDWIDQVEKMLVMWRGSQRDILPLGDLLSAVEVGRLRRHQIGWQRDPRVGHAAAQSVTAD